MGAYRELALEALHAAGEFSVRKTAEEGDISLEHGVHRSIVTAVAEEALSKSATLLYKGVDVEALKALHPQRETKAYAVVQVPEEVLEFEADDIRRACRTFPPGSTGVPSGLCPRHLQERLAADDDDKLATALADIAGDFMRSGESLPIKSKKYPAALSPSQDSKGDHANSA